jgi:hydroxymethylglutaryl-CoA reductase
MSDPKPPSPISSRIAGFYRNPLPRRVAMITEATDLSLPARQHLERGGGLDLAVADLMSENVISSHGLPLAVALNFRVNHRDYLVPMAVEEPSVVAAASNAARLVRLGGGFSGEADAPVMTAQVQFDRVDDPDGAALRVDQQRAELLAAADQAIPRMVERGGGCRDLEVRILDRAEGILVVDLFVDVVDAMGANLVNTVAETIAPALHELVGGQLGLRILSNLPLRRMVRVRAQVSVEAVGGPAVADGIARASRFAEVDPLRASTHNKGIMNGVDAAALALGQDWRSIEAGAHAYAARAGGYRPLATWRRSAEGLDGRLEMPLAVGTVGGATQVHPGVRAALELIRVANARELAMVLGAAGLASNLAALRALASEGIQRGHMKLHNRRLQHCADARRSS